MSKVLIVDDDKDIAELISLILSKEGIESYICDDPKEVLTIAPLYDLILLDIMMPTLSGTELCLKLRSKISKPILFISAKNDITDKIIGYEVGGDDYITKPFDNTELALKVKSHLRKCFRPSDNLININGITLNKESYEVTKDGKRIELSTREFELLRYLMLNEGIVLSKEQIFESVWGKNYGDIGTVAVNIKNLRNKIGNDYIITIWGYGYKFVGDIND